MATDVSESFKANLVGRGDPLVLILLTLAMLALMYGHPKAIKPVRFKVAKISLKISKENVRKGALALPLGLILIAGFRILRAKTTRIEASRTSLSIARGILIRDTDALSIVEIRDFKKRRGLTDLFLNTATIIVFSNDVTDPELRIGKLKAKDAELLYQHLGHHTNRTYTEFRSAPVGGGATGS